MKEYSSATQLLNNLASKGFDLQIPINVEHIASMLDILVIDDPRLEEIDSIGEISFCEEKAVIRINPFQNAYKPRRRFTLAHEIAHYCLHSHSSRKEFKDSRKTMSRSESYWDIYESEANGFAAQLLMPRELIVKAGNELILSYTKSHSVSDGMPKSEFIEQMASLFEVSNSAMVYRLKSLKIIS